MLKQRALALCFVWLLFVVLVGTAAAADAPFDTPANWDPHGTRVYPAQYLVASKQIYPFDFTIGFGNGRYGKQPLTSQGETFGAEMFTDNTSFRRDGQFFWCPDCPVGEVDADGGVQPDPL